MATKRTQRTKRRPWSKEDVRELRVHSKIVRAMKRTAGALRQKARSSLACHSAIDGELEPTYEAWKKILGVGRDI
jgi:hypothetical protein